MLDACFAQDCENERCGKGWVVQTRVNRSIRLVYPYMSVKAQKTFIKITIPLACLFLKIRTGWPRDDAYFVGA